LKIENGELMLAALRVAYKFTLSVNQKFAVTTSLPFFLMGFEEWGKRIWG